MRKKDMEALLKSSLASALELKNQDIDITKPFVEYGISSITAVNLVGELSNTLHQQLPPTIFWEYDNIVKLAKYLARFNASVKQTAPILAHNIIPEIKQTEALRKKIQSLYFNIATELQAKCDSVNLPFINFSIYDYLGFAHDKTIIAATITALKKYGSSASASRLAGGELPVHWELEHKLSQFLGTEDCVVFNSGHATNVTTIGHIMQPGDLILCDEFSHNSILQGAKLSHATLLQFKHNDTKDLADILEKNHTKFNKILIIIEGLYSMDGDIPNLPEIIRLKKQFKCLLYIDEAHSIGVLGETGRGIMEYWNIKPQEIDICMGTLGKALASIGGFIAGQKSLIQYLKYSAPGFVYSIGLNPAQAATALSSLKKLMQHPEYPQRLCKKSGELIAKLRLANINCGNCIDGPIVPIILSDSEKTLKLCSKLRQQGIFTQAIIYPAVEHNAARIRLFINRTHTTKVLDYTAKKIINIINSI